MGCGELVSLGATDWVGMGRKIGCSPPRLLGVGSAVSCRWCCFAPVLGVGVSVSLALRKEFECRYQPASFHFPAARSAIGFHSTALLGARKWDFGLLKCLL